MKPNGETAVTVNQPFRENGVTALPPGKRAVLIIDDNTAVREALSDILNVFLGVATFTAGNGREGLQIYHEQRHQITLIILDIEMPVMNGPQTYAQLQQLAPQVNVIVSSSLSLEEARSRFGAGKVPTFLQKPYSVETLLNILQSLLEL
ncbi:MAG: response regulator [Anaerolineaceae bacterium]|nr:response regulator [Anaerolineaceae bacterium]